MTADKTIVSWSAVGPDAGHVAPSIGARVSGLDGLTGKTRVTSAVVSAEGRTITTRSGSVYQLADALLAYREFCEEAGIEVDWENPFGRVR